MAMYAIQVPTSCFMQTRKSKRMYKMGKVGVKIGTYHISGNKFFHPLNIG